MNDYAAFWRCIDDARHTEGHIFVLTSNTFEDVDPADIEPIRCDLAVQFQRATRDLAKDLFLDFYSADVSLSGQHAFEFGDTLSELASQWTMHIEDDHFSMGPLQRMLIQHKGKPERAVQVMPTWILTQRARLR